MIKLSVPNIGDAECQAVERVLRSGQLVHGEEAEHFEKELADYLGVAEVVVVTSGTAALHLALVALGVGPGDAVIVPDFTFPATANVVELVGARPVFVDVDPGTYNLTTEGLRDVIASWQGPERLKAIMPVHEFGCPADMTTLMAIAQEHGLLVVEDAACALGATHGGRMAGTFGDAGCFSFHPRKALTTGEGGCIATSDRDLAHRLRQLRNHGMERTEQGIEFVLPGYNYRLTNFQAALGRVQLKHFGEWVETRRELKRIYDQALVSLDGLSVPSDIPGHSWQTYMVVLDHAEDRSEIIRHLREHGIEANLGAQSVSAQPFYRKKYGLPTDDWTSQRLFRQGLALPFCETYTPEDLESVIAALRTGLARTQAKRQQVQA